MAEFESKQEVLSPEQWKAQQKLAELMAKKKNQTEGLVKTKVKNNLILAIDTSGSMGMGFGKNLSRIQAAKHALDKIITASDSSETSYALISFNSSPHLIFPMNTPYSKFIACELYASGGTDMEGALRMALDQNPTRTILLSDGEAYVADDLIQQFVQRGIKIDCIAIADARDELLRHICEMTGGRFSRANDPDALDQLFLNLEPKRYAMLEHK